jgi:hypothetical protein
VDGAPNPPGRSRCDTFIQVSTFDAEGVTAAVREARPDGLAVVGTDQPVLTAAIACDRNGLFFPLSPETAAAATNKAVMKARCKAAGLPVPPSVLVTAPPADRDVEALPGPYVMKPVDSQGQRGVSLCSTTEELRRRFPDALGWSRQEYVMVEQYIPSYEVTVTGWVTEGTPEVLTITDRITLPPGRTLGVCLGHRFPSEYATGREGTIVDLTHTACRALGIEWGPIYFQFLVARSKVFINELACRLGGAYEDRSVPLVTGVDLIGRQLDLSLSSLQAAGTSAGAPRGSRRPIYEAARRPRRALRDRAFIVPLLFALPGTVAAFEPLDRIRAIPGVHAVHYLLPAGTVIRPLENSTQRIAYAVVAGESRRWVNAALERLFDRIGVYDAEGTNLLLNRVDDISFSGPL